MENEASGLLSSAGKFFHLLGDFLENPQETMASQSVHFQGRSVSLSPSTEPLVTPDEPEYKDFSPQASRSSSAGLPSRTDYSKSDDEEPKPKRPKITEEILMPFIASFADEKTDEDEVRELSGNASGFLGSLCDHVASRNENLSSAIVKQGVNNVLSIFIPPLCPLLKGFKTICKFRFGDVKAGLEKIFENHRARGSDTEANELKALLKQVHIKNHQSDSDETGQEQEEAIEQLRQRLEQIAINDKNFSDDLNAIYQGMQSISINNEIRIQSGVNRN